MSEQCTEERLLKDVEKHTMTVIRADGVNRHLRFRQPDTSSYWFDLITWPGALCINGDCGTYVFSRTQDMFEFFRTDANYAHKKGFRLGINPGYWGEKLTAISAQGGYQKFSEDKFTAAIKDYFDNYVQEDIEAEAEARKEAAENDTPLSQADEEHFKAKAEARDELWSEITEQVLDRAEYGEGTASTAAYEFAHKDFQFQDFFETNLKELTFSYIWCCYAIAWGIEQFDATTTVAVSA
ncbi:hypothetical protein LP414_27500 [Polaromonas sp. P1(28)-13]|nr:hypothetical protein LP414_27500 [Polaromonas sp. P1(28)-13]